MSVKIIVGDALERLAELPDESVHCVVTSPPYWGLRDYGVAGQIGLEPTIDDHIAVLVAVFRDVRRVLRSDGTLWLNYGDAYANDGKWGGSTGGKHAAGLHGGTGVGRQKVSTGLKPKDLMMMPARVALALQDDGWWLRSDIIWHKPNPMPESVTDRPTSAHEHVFLMTKSARYFYDADAIKVPASPDSHARYARGRSDTHKYADGGPGNQTIATSFAHMDKQAGHGRRHAGFNERWEARDHPKTADPGQNIKNNSSMDAALVDMPDLRNARNVWTISPHPFSEAHFATFPPALVVPCIKAGCPAGGTVLDPFGGAGTTGLVADRLQRNAILIELNQEYAEMARRRIDDDAPLFGKAAE